MGPPPGSPQPPMGPKPGSSQPPAYSGKKKGPTQITRAEQKLREADGLDELGNPYLYPEGIIAST